MKDKINCSDPQMWGLTPYNGSYGTLASLAIDIQASSGLECFEMTLSQNPREMV
jgi:hypothetical protein